MRHAASEQRRSPDVRATQGRPICRWAARTGIEDIAVEQDEVRAERDKPMPEG